MNDPACRQRLKTGLLNWAVKLLTNSAIPSSAGTHSPLSALGKALIELIDSGGILKI